MNDRDIKLAQAIENYETMLYKNVREFSSAARMGDPDLAFLFMSQQIIILNRLQSIVGSSKSKRIFSDAYSQVFSDTPEEDENNGWKVLH